MKAVYSRLARAAGMGVGLALVLAAFSTPAWAFNVPVPEIDPGSMAGAVTLLSLGVLMLTDRRRKK
ncbi:MAG TPA: hypothetical protein VJY33_13195 [Isosphaeraceae bacterium]|nr:hypothetical protein [Isosphaeraceae bacterium]